jgi:hypothetical protein
VISGDSGRRALAGALIVALIVAALHLIFRLSGAFLVGALNDDGVYVVLAKAIAQGDGYRSIHLVAAPVQVRYPPGLPLLLALPWKLGGTLAAVRATVSVINLAATAAAAGLIWWFGKKHLKLDAWPLAVCAIAPFVLDGTIEYFNIPLTEPYLVLGWIAALVLAQPLFEAQGEPALSPPAVPPLPPRRQLIRAAGVGLVLAGTTLFRSAGIVLIPAIVLALLLHRRWWTAGAVAAASVVPLLVWRVLEYSWIAAGPVSTAPDDLGYWKWFAVDGPLALVRYAAAALVGNTIEYVPKLASYLFSNLPLGVTIVVIGALAAGFSCVRLWRTQSALVFTTIAAAALTLLWPFAQGRLLLPLLPFLGLLVAAAIAHGAQRLTPRARVLAVPAVLSVLLLLVASRQMELREAAGRAYVTGAARDEDKSPAMTLAVRSRFIALVSGWIQAHTASTDRIMVDAPAAVYLYTGRRAVGGHPTESRFATSVFQTPGRYLADRILADSLTVVVWAPLGGGGEAGLDRDVATIADRCPRVLAREPSPVAVVFRVTRDERCLRERVLEPPPVSQSRVSNRSAHGDSR